MSFRFNPEISWGHVMQAVLIIVGLTAGYVQLKADVQARTETLSAAITIAKLETSREVDANRSKIEAQNQVIAAQLGAIREAIGQVQKDLSQLKRQ